MIICEESFILFIPGEQLIIEKNFFYILKCQILPTETSLPECLVLSLPLRLDTA
jgi:hypothetical protein